MEITLPAEWERVSEARMNTDLVGAEVVKMKVESRLRLKEAFKPAVSLYAEEVVRILEGRDSDDSVELTFTRMV